jgi:hypothetical protein
MHKIGVVLLLILSFFFVRPLVPSAAAAAPFVCTGTVQPSANISYSSDKALYNSNLGPGENFTVSFTVSGSSANQIQNAKIQICDESANGVLFCSSGDFSSRSYATSRNGNTFTATIPASILAGKSAGDWTAVFRGNFSGQGEIDMCPLVDSMFATQDLTITGALVDCSQLTVSPQPITAATSQITVSYPRDAIRDNGNYLLNIWRGGLGSAYSSSYFTRGTGIESLTVDINPADLPDNASVALDRDLGGRNQRAVCTIPLNYNAELGEVVVGEPIDEDAAEEQVAYVQGFDYCSQAPAGPQREACIACIGPVEAGGEQTKVYTAFGCMGTNGEDLTRDLVRLLLGIVGGIALLSTLAAAFLLTTSQGEVSKVKSAKELITASVSGILFIIFSIMILDFIGVRILRIPGLS